jgi:hypothetical protein
MRFTSARKAIHDSFAIHLTTPDGAGIGSGTKFDSNQAVFNATKAGLVIGAVLDQRDDLRGCAMLMNAPDQSVQGSDIDGFKKGLWLSWTKNTTAKLPDQAEVMANLDRIIMGYRARCWNPSSEKFSLGAVFSYATPAAKTRLLAFGNEVHDVINRMDSESLQPVWAVIQDQKDKYHAAIDRESEEGLPVDGSLPGRE